ALVDPQGNEQCRVGPLLTMPTYSRISPSRKILALLDEYGLISIYRTVDGGLIKQFMASELGDVLRFTPDSRRLLLGSFQGGIHLFDFNGQKLWSVRLGDLNDLLGQELPLYDSSIKDYTDKLWPASRDVPRQLDKLVRMGANRLTNGDCEQQGGWSGSNVLFHDGGFRSSRCLRINSEMIGQDLTKFLGRHVTWVLEFFFRSVSPKEKAELLAGVMSENRFPDSLARTFEADEKWRFGRVVIKNGTDCKKLSVGFLSKKGEALVDQVQFRRIRFPSVNHLLYEPFYKVKPVVLDNPLYSEQYDPLGRMRDEAPNRIVVEAIRTGALNLVESAFLQNGRINEIGNNWFIQPFGTDVEISCGLKE
ncbi:MAG: WD40 repeat domain-containing protein, partial [Planctomycetota bacterium]|nr:WD40 repeat domain-containing protein [Planctomycetota bacterium]